jgi:hypothetical protein
MTGATGMKATVKFAIASSVLACCVSLGVSRTSPPPASALANQTARIGDSDASGPQPVSSRQNAPSVLAASVVATNAGPSQGADVSNVDPRHASPDRTIAPRVTFRDGVLSIRAAHVALKDVLQAVERATGASISFSDSAGDLVHVDLGPADSRAVLTSLLEHSQYDYVLVASPTQQDLIERVVLTRRRAGATTPSMASPDPQPQVAERAEMSAQPAVDMKQTIKQQELQFQRQFGACVAQGCDAS